MLSVAHLEFKRSRFSLGPLSFQVGEGKLLRVIGKNGSGKTSLLRILLGSLKASSGTVEKNFSSLAQVGVGASLFESWSVEENLNFIERLHTTSLDEELKNRALRVSGYRVNQLSSGMKRDLELSLQLSLETPLTLLDEAFTFLDQSRAQFFESQIRRRLSNGQSFIVSAHSKEERFNDIAEDLHL